MALNISNIPEELRALPQWVVHKGKIPHNPSTGRRASVTDPTTWGTFEAACVAVGNDFAGLGFVFTPEDSFVGVDFDHCLNNGELDPWVASQLDLLNSYTEVSPSGTGLHVFCKGTLLRSTKTSKAELYDRNRYFTVTGNSYGVPRPIRAPGASLLHLSAELSKPNDSPTAEALVTSRMPVPLSDAELLEKAQTAQNGMRFAALWAGDMTEYAGDHSRADMALCNLLAYWTNGDIERMDRIFRQSGLMRDKWDRRQTGSTYGRLQLEKAVKEMTVGYDPDKYRTEQAKKDFATVPSPAGLSIINAADLATKYLPPVRFLVDDFLPQGLALLSAPPKYGKSWFVLDLCLSVAKGIPFLGRKTNRCDCLYLALEDSENRLKSRMIKLLDGAPAPDNFFFGISAPDLANGLTDQLDLFLTQHPNTGMIVIDTLQKIRGPSSRSEGAYKYDYREMGQIKSFADRHGILVLLVHHLRKMADDSDPHNRISGTNGIMGAADTSMVLARAKREDSETTLSITGRDVNGEELILNFNKDQCKWEVAGTPEEISRRNYERKYSENPLVKVIKTLVTQGGGEWRGRMKALNEESYNILGDKLLEDNELRKYPGMLKSIKDDLEYYDGITYRRMANGTSRGSGDYVFTASVLWETHTESTDPYCGF